MYIPTISKKLLKSSELEKQKFVFLINPVAYMLQMRSLGFKVKSLQDIELLYEEVKSGRKHLNFFKLRSKIKANAKQINSLKNKAVIVD